MVDISLSNYPQSSPQHNPQCRLAAGWRREYHHYGRTEYVIRFLRFFSYSKIATKIDFTIRDICLHGNTVFCPLLLDSRSDKMQFDVFFSHLRFWQNGCHTSIIPYTVRPWVGGAPCIFIIIPKMPPSGKPRKKQKSPAQAEPQPYHRGINRHSTASGLREMPSVAFFKRSITMYSRISSGVALHLRVL